MVSAAAAVREESSFVAAERAGTGCEGMMTVALAVKSGFAVASASFPTSFAAVRSATDSSCNIFKLDSPASGDHLRGDSTAKLLAAIV